MIENYELYSFHFPRENLVQSLHETDGAYCMWKRLSITIRFARVWSNGVVLTFLRKDHLLFARLQFKHSDWVGWALLHTHEAPQHMSNEERVNKNGKRQYQFMCKFFPKAFFFFIFVVSSRVVRSNGCSWAFSCMQYAMSNHRKCCVYLHCERGRRGFHSEKGRKKMETARKLKSPIIRCAIIHSISIYMMYEAAPFKSACLHENCYYNTYYLVT